MLALLFLCVLAIAPSPAPPPPVAPASYDAAIVGLESASKEANRGVSPVTIENLERALDTVEAYPTELSDDPAGHAEYELALLNYARLMLAKGDRVAAEQAMERAIFAAGDRPVEAERFGPELAAFYEEQAAVIAARGQATLEVTCHVLCKVYVDSNELDWTSAELPIGTHRVQVISVELDPLVTQVDLRGSGAMLEYGAPQGPAVVGIDEDDEPPRERALMWGQVERPIPRWKLIGLGTSAGVLLAGAGVGIGFAVAASSATNRISIEAADSLLDEKPENDIDPDAGSAEELCALAQASPDPARPDEVTNAPVSSACFDVAGFTTARNAGLIVAGVGALSTVTFGLLLNTYRPHKARAGLRPRPALGLAPRLEGGLVVVGSLRF